jgi:gliding motility-associated-like protein
VNIKKEDIIEVHERPIAYFEVRPGQVFIPDMPVNTRNLSQGATHYYWDFGDGTASTDMEPEHYYKEEGQFDITLLTYNEHCYDSLTRKAAVIARSAGRVLLPNAFTPSRSGPNGSGENDQFVPLLSDVAEYRLQIFNRWGELIFEGVNQGWDGYYQGRLSPQDVYVYKVELIFNNGEKGTRVGDVNLIR